MAGDRDQVLVVRPEHRHSGGFALAARRARELLLTRLERFHAGRKEAYDHALQVNNIGLAYLNESRYEPALGTSTRRSQSSRQQRETQRIAVALQNIALCEWGMGRLSAAIPRLERALGLMSPQPYPDLYLATLYTSALANFAAGRFDESLRLNAQALDLATSLQLDRARARAYYGMGVAYYGIGDRDLAARFLRSSLEILTADVDARGRVSALRSLAVLEHETGDLAQASAHNSEALRLATAPSARSRIILRLAADYLAQKQTAAALGMLNPLAGASGDALVQALARAQRGKLLPCVRRPQRRPSRCGVRGVDASYLRSRHRMSSTRAWSSLVSSTPRATTRRRSRRSIARWASPDEITAQTVNPEYRASIAQSVRPARRFQARSAVGSLRAPACPAQHRCCESLALESLRSGGQLRALAFDQLRAQRLDTGHGSQAGRAATNRDDALSGYLRAPLPALDS